MPKYEMKQVKSMLNVMKCIDGWFWCKYTTNPYVGCEHACIYCDARSQKYYLHDDFEETIYVKENAAKVLENQLKTSRTLIPDVVAMAGVCDAYQQAENKYLITQQMLKIFLKYKFPVFVSTKSDLIIRDLDLLEEIGKVSSAAVFFTITSLDDEIANFLEPGASTSKKRLDAIKFISSKYKNIKIGVNFMPIVPFLEDSDENIESVIRLSKEAGAHCILIGAGMTMRDNQEKFFLNKLQKKYPELVPKFHDLFRGNYNPNKEYVKMLNRKTSQLCKKYELPMRLKRFIPNDYRKHNYILAEKLLNEAYEREITEKPHFGFQKAAFTIQSLPESIFSIYNRGMLNKIEFISPDIELKIKNYLSSVDSSSDSTLDKFWT
jgi:DNA repair photolyase